MKVIVLFLCLIVLAVSKPVPIQLLDETSLPQIDSNESESVIVDRIYDVPVMRKPNKVADKKHKIRVDGSPIEKMSDFPNPMDLAPGADLFQQLMMPIENTSNEMERMFNMKYEKFGENPRPEGPK